MKGIDFIMIISGNFYKFGCIVCEMFVLDFKS